MTALNVHRSREREPRDRGHALGRAQREAIANTRAVYLRMFSEDVGLDVGDVLRRGAQVGDRVSPVRPDLVEEIEGIAAGAGQPPELMLALNARTELLSGGTVAGGAAECSVAGVVGGSGRCLLSQTWDFHPDLAGSRLLWTVEQQDGLWFTTFTEAGLVAKTGLNGAGLGVTLNFLASEADGGVDGLPVHVLLRTLLDSCRDAAAAERALSEARLAASACVTVASAAGGRCALASYELSPRGVEAVRPDDRGLLAHTNHFVVPGGARDVALDGAGAASTLSRLEQVRDDLRGLDAPDAAALGELLSTRRSGDGAEPVFRLDSGDLPWLERTATLATLVYDLGERRMWIRTECDPRAPLAEMTLP